MHVLIIPSWYPSNPGDVGGSFFREQALALQKYGCKVGVISTQIRSLRNIKALFFGQYGTKFETDSGIPTYRYHGVNFFRFTPGLMRWFIEKAGLYLYKQYVKKNGKPDILHAHSIFYGAFLAQKISQTYKIPYVVTEHSTAFGKGLITNDLKEKSKKILTSASEKIAVSEPFAVLLERFYGNKWCYIPNIVSSIFTNQEINIINKLNEFVFINVAMHIKSKAIDNLIYAFSHAFGENPLVKLKLVGDGVERQHLELLVKELGLSDRISFLGMLKREETCRELSGADVFVLSSRHETFCVAVVEALALGKPVVATLCGGPESSVRKEDGILVDVDNIQALSSAMLKIYNNYSSYKFQAIRESAIERFGERSVTQTLKLRYEQIIAKI